MRSDQSTDPEQKVMGRLCELSGGCLPHGAVPEHELRAAVVELLATEAMPPAGVYQQKENGGVFVQLMVPADPSVEHVSVELYDPDTDSGVQVMLPQLEARAMVGAAAVVEKTRGFVADTYEQMLAELDYQVRCYRAGQVPQPPDDREPTPGQPRVVLEFDGSQSDAEVVRVSVSNDGTLSIDVDEAARLLGFDDRQTATLRVIARGDTCLHPGMPPASSVAPFERRNCPMCGARMQSYPGTTTDSGEPEWSAIP